MDALPTLVCAATAVYVPTNVDGYALLLTYFSNSRYRAAEIAAGQFISMAVQIALSISIMKSGWVTNTPWTGLAGIAPLIVGLTRIRGLSQDSQRDVQSALRRETLTSSAGSTGRVLAVAAVATSGAVDNVLAYSGLLIGKTPEDVSLVTILFGALTAGLCLAAYVTARSHVSISPLRRTIARVAPFTTTAIGLALLLRFDTLAWIYSFA
ncbi:hypothetical protein [Paraburkholderia dilworthii]|uniref:hypothetical protein n=1 Tax=Paraburkholderia dilworthii TaxID=948106 RepID=UPI00041BF066|nr:hypothetical protein [Paraburkholderia dilworthii]